MSWQNRLAHLEKEHHALNKQIDTLEKTELFSDNRINEMKKQRLHLKDQIAKLREQHESEINEQRL